MLGWAASILSILGVLFNAKKNIWCWPIWTFANFLWIVYSIKTQQWSQLVLWNVFIAGNIYGWVQWNKAKK